MNFCLYPGGAWSTAIALHLQRLGHTISLVPHQMDEALDLATSRVNPLLPNARLPNPLQIGLELQPSLMEADVLILGVPSRYLREACRKVAAALGAAWQLKDIVVLTKGLEEGSNLLPCQVVAQELPQFRHHVLSGPTFASQVAAGKPSAIVLASEAGDEALQQLQEAMSGPSLRVYTSTDVAGVCLGGSLKNVYAIAAGCCDGLELGDNAKAALLTRSLAEMVRVGEALGGRIETFYGLSGFGDLMLTCNGEESRNRTFGELISRGESIHTLIEERRMTVEGYRTAACFVQVCKERNIDAPILMQIEQILFFGKSPAAVIEALMSRSLKAESSR